MLRSPGIITFLLVLLCVAATAFSLELMVEVKPALLGNTYLSNVDDTMIIPTELSFFWENFGSVSCMYRIRLDLYNASRTNIPISYRYTVDNKTEIDPLETDNQRMLEATFWGEGVLVPPGTGRFLNVSLFTPHAGSYIVQPRIFACNEYFALAPTNITLHNRTLLPLDDVDVRYKVTEEEILFKIKSKEAINTLSIITPDTSREIVIDSDTFAFNDTSEVRIVSLSSIPVTEVYERNVTFHIFANGSHYTNATIFMTSKENKGRLARLLPSSLRFWKKLE